MTLEPQSRETFEDPTAGARRVDPICPVARFADNPILTCHDVNRVWEPPALKVETVHNAGIAEFEGRIVMLFRSHLRDGTSVLGLARSNDGIHDWRVDPEPAMLPCREGDLLAEGADPTPLIENESGGIEDPRVTRIGDTYYVTYSAYHARIKDRVRVSLATTTDFVSFVRHGPVLNRDMRNVVIFPEPIGGTFVGLFRPNDSAAGDVGGAFTEIRIGTTDRIESNRWAIGDRPLRKTGGGPSAFADKIGPGAPPLRTRHGWLSISTAYAPRWAATPTSSAWRCMTWRTRSRSRRRPSRSCSRADPIVWWGRPTMCTCRTSCSRAGPCAGRTARS